MRQEQWIAGTFPLLALAAILFGVSHTVGHAHTAASVHNTVSVRDVADWLLRGTAMEADIEASEAEAQQALVSVILGGAPMGRVISRQPGAEVGSPVPAD
jgi:hypothetical protein